MLSHRTNVGRRLNKDTQLSQACQRSFGVLVMATSQDNVASTSAVSCLEMNPYPEL